jgi:hypothetical protein
MQLNYVVTGTGRCGTVYFAKLLTNLGIQCGHETIFFYDGFENAKKRLNGQMPFSLSRISKSATGQGEKGWFPEGIRSIQADSSYMVAPFLDDPLFDNVAIIHLVRNPMEVINSFVEGFGYFRDSCMHRSDESCYHSFIYRHAPTVLEYSGAVDRAAVFYIEWNKMIEEKSKNRKYLRFNINNRSFKKVFWFLGMDEPEDFLKKKLNERHTNKRYHSISQIPSPELRDQLFELYSRYCYIKM